MIKSDPLPPPASTSFPLSSLFPCRLTVVPLAHFDRENSEVVIPFRDLTFSPFFPLSFSLSPTVLPLSRPSFLPSITLCLSFFCVCSNNRVIPRVYRVSSDPIARQFSSRAIFFPSFVCHVRARASTIPSKRSRSATIITRAWNLVTARMIYRAGNRVHEVTRLYQARP